MSLRQTINYDVAGNFTFDHSKIEIVGGKAALKLGPNAGLLFSQDFSSSSGFTLSNPDAIEVAASKVRQISQVPPNATYGAKFSDSINGSFGGGNLVTTPHGGAQITGNKLDLTGGGYIEIDGASNVSQLTSKGTIRFRVTLNYDGSPSDNQVLFHFSDGNNNQIMVTHLTNGNLFLLCTDENGVAQVTSTIGSFPGVMGQESEVEVSWDLDTDKKFRIFGQGFLFSEIDADYVRGAATLLEIGASNAVANFLMRDLIVFDDVEHTATYPGGVYTVPAKAYIECSAALPAFVYAGVGEIQALTLFSATESDGSARYIIDGQYWDGDSWAVSDGTFAQASTKADVIANIATLPAVSPLNVSVIFGNSDTINSVDMLSVGYTGQIYPTDDPAIENSSGVGLDGLDGFDTDYDATCSDDVRFQLRIGATLKWWNGSAWATSDGTLAQSNTTAEIADHAGALDLTAGGTLKLRALLSSNDGETTPEITSATIDYNFFAADPGPLAECIVYGHLRDFLGEGVSEAALVIQAPQAAKAELRDSFVILPIERRIKADADGRIEVSLVETESTDKAYKFLVEYKDPDGRRQRAVLGSAQVPSQDSVNLADLTFT